MTAASAAPDTRGYTYSEEHRHRCEVRQVLRWRAERGRDWVHGWINGVAPMPGQKAYKGVRQMRGDAAAERLLADCVEQFGRGNDGTGDRWL